MSIVKYILIFAFVHLLFLSSLSRSASLESSRILFHAGQRELLDEDVAAKTIPQKAWDNFIMGKTNFDLPEYRKGLYGAENLSGTSLYSLYQFLGGNDAWVMAIKLKQECVEAKAVYGGGYYIKTDAPSPTRFEKWYQKNRSRYQSLEPKCAAEFNSFTAWEEGELYNLGKASPEVVERTKLCTPTLLQFLNDEKLKVIFDQVNDDSWYIRDRSCIETITGTPDDLFNLIFDNKIGDEQNNFPENFWGDSAKPGTYFGGSTLLALSVLSQANLLQPDALSKIKKIGRSITDYIGNEKEKVSKLSLDANNDNPFILRRILVATVGAIEKSELKNFQKDTFDFLKQMRSDYQANCDGKNGVPADKRESCALATYQQTQRLIKLLEKYKK